MLQNHYRCCVGLPLLLYEAFLECLLEPEVASRRCGLCWLSMLDCAKGDVDVTVLNRGKRLKKARSGM